MPEEISAQELEQLLQMMTLPQPPYLLAGIGLLMGVLCGLTFGRQVQNKLDGWKQDRLPLMPWGLPRSTSAMPAPSSGSPCSSVAAFRSSGLPLALPCWWPCCSRC